MWDCGNRGQVLSAAFEVHQAAMEHAFMPDEATNLSMSLAKLCTSGGVVSVYFSEGGWRVEVASTGGVVQSACYARTDSQPAA